MMTKIFDPKISPAPWESLMDEFLGPICSDHHSTNGIPDCDNDKAVLAIPEMLEVVKAAQKYFNTEDAFNELNLLRELKKKLDELNEKHGTES